MAPSDDRSTARGAATHRPRPTMQEVAHRAGVGIKTVSRVVNEESHVATATVERVRAAIDELGYEPDMRAGALRRSSGPGTAPSGAIGMLLGSPDNPFATSIYDVFAAKARERGAVVMTASLDREEGRERQAVTGLLRHRVDGLLISTPTHDLHYLDREREHGVGMVVIDGVPTGLDCDSVNSENRGGASLAVRHLIKYGHHDIAYLGARSDVFTISERRQGFLDEARRHGLRIPDAWLLDDLDAAEATDTIAALLNGPNRPTALFAAQNSVTIHTLRVLRDLGLQKKIALVGFDDFPLSDLVDPGVTVIAQDPQVLAEHAAARLFARIDGDQSPAQRQVFPVHLIARGSGELSATPTEA